jgi:hypothetical protein
LSYCGSGSTFHQGDRWKPTSLSPVIIVSIDSFQKRFDKNTLISWNPAFASSCLAERTAWKAGELHVSCWIYSTGNAGGITGWRSIDKGQKVQSRLLQILGQVGSHVEHPGIVAEAARSSMRRDNVESRIVEL